MSVLLHTIFFQKYFYGSRVIAVTIFQVLSCSKCHIVTIAALQTLL